MRRTFLRIEEFNFPSADKKTEIHTYRWSPDGKVKAVLQIVHGMVEHVSRYEEFAEYLTSRGILVTGNDQLGHGKSIASKEELWNFPKNGNAVLLKDIHTLRLMTRKKYPSVPYFILGHSMGSYLLRQYLCFEGEGLSGAIIMGTGNEKKPVLMTAEVLAAMKCKVQGRTHHTRLLTLMAFGNYCKRIHESPTGHEWLSRDPEKVREYKEDVLCGGRFTNSAFREFFRCMLYLKKKEHLQKMPKDLPILLASGEEDPVGNYGKSVRQVEGQFRDLGIADVTCILYPGDRHEILNELDRDQVYADLAAWIEKRI